MAKSKAMYFLVPSDQITAFDDKDKVEAAIAAAAPNTPTLIVGNSVEYAVEAKPRVTFGKAKERKPRAKKAAAAAPAAPSPENVKKVSAALASGPKKIKEIEGESGLPREDIMAALGALQAVKTGQKAGMRYGMPGTAPTPPAATA